MTDDAILRELQDPSLPAHRLAEISALSPDYWAYVMQHPAVYPDLSAWIQGQCEQPQEQQPQAQQHQPLQQQPEQPSQQVEVAESPSVAAPKATARQKLGWVFGGILIGLLVGGALATALVLWVLPGLFGGILG